MKLFRLVGLVALVAVLADWSVAQACGMVARPRRTEKSDSYTGLPYLALEQTLIMWDRASRTEDFIREARFARTNEPFGFVVPVPSRPEVTKIDSPFPTLRKEYPHEPPASKSRSSGSGAPAGGAGGKVAAPPPVEVLSVDRIGSFEVTVLRAIDATALDAWLEKNGFELTEPAKPWLAHYVTLRFHFVAFKYAGAPPGSQDGMTSETVRIRFESGAPYYPYLEPELAKGASLPEERRLAVWLVTEDPMIPIVTHTKGAEWTWQTPWRPSPAPEVLTANFLARIPSLETAGIPIRARKVVVQPFLDVRTSRKNLGDAVFGYRASHDLDGEAVAALRPLMPALDGRIAATEASEKPKARACGIASAVDAGSTSERTTGIVVGGIAALAITVVARRRRRPPLGIGVVLGLVATAGVLLACRGRASVSDPKEQAVVELLSGRPPYTLVLSSEARLVTTMVADRPKPEGGVEATPSIVESASWAADCVGKMGVPPSIELAVETDAKGTIGKITATSSSAMEKPAVDRLETCWKSALVGKTLVTPAQVAKMKVHVAVSQDVTDL